MNAVFDVKSDSVYDDDIASHYHFPRRYLRIAQQCIGDWIILRQPRAGHGSKAYIATANIEAIRPDPVRADHYYAFLRQFLRFDEPVRWRDGKDYREEALRELADQTKVGLYLRGRSMRLLSNADFQEIVWTGFRGTVSLQALDLAGDSSPFQFPDRRIHTVLLNRAVRDSAFRAQVCNAYDGRCAISGLRLVDHAGSFEAEAAHILPVASGGPDTLNNGIALSRTLHWMFDRHLISVSESLDVLTHPLLPNRLVRHLSKRLITPANAGLSPDSKFIALHREKFWSKLRASV